jgi:tetratricopeptide (TPR) repeat protein
MTDTPEHIENADLDDAVDYAAQDDMQGAAAYDSYHGDEAPDSEETLAALTESLPKRLTRIERLTLAIERDPNEPANYVYRGEAYLEKDEYDLAAQDFHTAIELADAEIDTANWGFIYSALIDRARENLRHI